MRLLQSHFRIEASNGPEQSVLKLFGELDIASAPVLEQELARVGDSGRVVIDLRELEFIDSTGLSVLVRASQQAEERSADLSVLSAGDGQVHRLLDLTGLQERLRVTETP